MAHIHTPLINSTPFIIFSPFHSLSQNRHFSITYKAQKHATIDSRYDYMEGMCKQGHKITFKILHVPLKQYSPDQLGRYSVYNIYKRPSTGSFPLPLIQQAAKEEEEGEEEGSCIISFR